jgi:hypothetical protein
MTIVIGIKLLLLAAQSSRVSKTGHAKQRGSLVSLSGSVYSVI